MKALGLQLSRWKLKFSFLLAVSILQVLHSHMSPESGLCPRQWKSKIHRHTRLEIPLWQVLWEYAAAELSRSIPSNSAQHSHKELLSVVWVLWPASDNREGFQSNIFNTSLNGPHELPDLRDQSLSAATQTCLHLASPKLFPSCYSTPLREGNAKPSESAHFHQLSRLLESFS